MKFLKHRFFYVIILGVIIASLIHGLVPVPEESKVTNGFFYSLLLTIAITFCIWEGSLAIDKRLNKLFSWDKHPMKRVLLQSVTNLIYSNSIILIGSSLFDYFVCKMPKDMQGKMSLAGLIVGSLITLIVMAFEIGTQFFKKWKASLLEVEKYKKETTEAQLENLKSQVNPHFLFNNLSVLSSLVYKNQDKAVDFISQFSKVYRYILDNNSKELVALETELKFIESYCYLLSIRFGAGISFKLSIEPEKLQLLIPPMALQLLIENTIKHNETSLEMPLLVEVFTQDDYLIVTNNLQTRALSEGSSKMGLKNIISRYKHYTESLVQVHATEKSFEVQLPLLKNQ